MTKNVGSKKHWYNSLWVQVPAYGTLLVLALALGFAARTQKSAEIVMFIIMFASLPVAGLYVWIIVRRDAQWHSYSSRVRDFDIASRANFEERERIYTDKSANFRAIITLENGQQFLTTSNVAHLRTRPLISYELRIRAFWQREYRNISFHSSPQD